MPATEPEADRDGELSSDEHVPQRNDERNADFDNTSDYRSITPSPVSIQYGDSDSAKSCMSEVSETSKMNKKRKLDMTSNVPKLIDNKRKNLEKRLSAAQRDQKLLEAAKQDTEMRKDMLQCFKDSSSTTAHAIENMAVTLKDMSQGMTQAMLIMANSLSQQQQQQQPTPVYAPYQFNQPLLSRPNEHFNESESDGQDSTFIQLS